MDFLMFAFHVESLKASPNTAGKQHYEVIKQYQADADNAGDGQ